MKHTPGPWRVGKYGGVYSSHPEHDYAICGLSHKDGTGRRNYKANARLIASAPELLEACKCALKSLGFYLDFYAKEEDYNGHDAIKSLHKAVNKAENNCTSRHSPQIDCEECGKEKEY